MALIKCPDCGRDVSTLAVACPGCARPIAAQANPGVPQPSALSPPSTLQPQAAAPAALPGMLRSNLGDAAVAPPPTKKRGFPTGAILLMALVAVIAAAVLLLMPSSAQPAPRSATSVPTPAQVPTSTAVAPVGANPQRAISAAAPLPAINDISCDALESTIFHIHVHLALFVDGQEQVIPFGVGIGQPWEVSDSNEGPFVTNGTCFYWIHTHTEDGVLHIESPIRRTFTLGDFFGIWQQPLSATQMGPIKGTIIAYVNGVKVDTNPADIRLLSHERIQLNSGQDVPPVTFDFPPGD